MNRRLLYVTPFSLLPRTEGHRKRMAMTLDAIKQAGFEVHILFISREYGWSALFDPKTYRDLLDLADLTFFCHAPTPAPPREDVYTLDEWWPSHCDDYVRWVLSNNGYEFIFCNYIFMSRVFELAERSTIKILDTHDVFADRKRLLISHGLRPEFYYTTAKSELEGIERADIVLAIKEQEAELFRRVSDVSVVTLPYFEDGPPDRPKQPKRRGPRMRFGFFASDNAINVKNIIDFIDFLAQNEPGAGYGFDLCLYGSLLKRMPRWLPAFVERGGYIDTVDQFYDAVDCVVNPQYFSTGLKIKVAEALAFHAPLICHRHSFEGFGEPAHRAQDCDGFPAILDAMQAATRDADFLEDIRQASVFVQTRLVEESGRQLAKVLSGSKAGLKWLYIFVDREMFNHSRLYRHMVESFFSTFCGDYLIALVSDAGAGVDGPWDEFYRKANRSASGLTAEVIEAGARRVFFDDPARHLEGDAASEEGIVFIDAARIARGLCGPAWEEWLERAALSHTLVRCRGAGEPAGGDGAARLAVRYFRWLPWDLTLSGGAGDHDLTSEVWVLGEERVDDRWYDVVRAAFPGLEVRVFREDCGVDGAGHCAIARLNDAAFTHRTVPGLVIRLAADPGFDVFAEWCAANGVPFRDYAEYARPEAWARAGRLPASRLSDFARAPGLRQEHQAAVSSWGASGWEELARFLSAGPRDRSPGARNRRSGIASIVVHIGSRKAGSSSIQSFLSANEDGLRRIAIEYPRAGRLDRTNHVNLAWEIQGGRQFDAGYGTLSELADHWRGAGGESMILSAEAFEECGTAEAARLKELARRGEKDFRIVLYLRDLVDLTPSRYAHMIKSGRKTRDFDTFFQKKVQGGRIDYFDTTRRWAEAFGWESLRVRLLDSRHLVNGDLIDDFLEIVGLDADGADARRFARPGLVNVSPGWRVVEAVRALYGGRHGLSEGHPLVIAGGQGKGEREALGLRAAEVGERWGWNQDKGRYLTRAQARHCLDVYAATIEALNQRLPRALPPPLDLDARGFQEREFTPDASQIPLKELAAFYDELAKAMSQRRGVEAAQDGRRALAW